jgi:hypothetical protein
MTIFEKNTAIRTVFLGVLACALLGLLYQVSKAVLAIEQDVQSVTSSSDALLARARWFVPDQKIDVSKINGVTANAQALLKTGNRTLQLVNAPCVPGPCGLLADGAKTLNTARMTMGQVEIAANHEDKNLATLDKQEATIFADTHADLDALHGLVTAPDLLATVHNMNTTSAAFADSAKQADAILADGKLEADKFAHPSKKKLTFWGAILATGQTIQKLSPPLF